MTKDIEALPVNGVEASTEQKIFQEYLQKCCEAGQIQDQLDQLDSQRREMEKKLEITQKEVKSVRNKHKEAQMEKYSKMKVKTPESETPMKVDMN